jgi:hypothetical protein
MQRGWYSLPMARELDSGMLRRLQENYSVMSDGELQAMAAKPDDLTDMALEILRGEMTRRRLDAVQPVDTIEAREMPDGFGGDPFASLSMRPTWGKPENVAERKGWVSLMVFYDAIELGRACDFLDEQIEFEIHDRSKPPSALTPFQRPVEMDLQVQQVDQQRAMATLREKMGLFPLQEVEMADAPLDDGTVTTLGDFGHRADAEEVARVLEQANLWHRIVANEEGTIETEDLFRLQVREIDLMAAGEVVEKAMDLPEA